MSNYYTIFASANVHKKRMSRAVDYWSNVFEGKADNRKLAKEVNKLSARYSIRVFKGKVFGGRLVYESYI